MNDETENSDPMDDWAAAMAEAGHPQEETAEADTAQPDAAPDQNGQDAYERAELENLQDEGAPPDSEDVNLDVILDIPVNISMAVGHTKINIRNLLQLNQGSVVELDRLAGEPLDVLVNGTLIAHGEVVVVNEKYGIRLTDVISPAERIKKLK